MGKKYTYGQLSDVVENASAFLYRNNVRKGSRIALMVPNSPVYAIMFFALARLGAWLVQMNPLYTTREIELELQNAHSVQIITTPEFYEKVSKIDGKTVETIFLCKLEDYLPGVKSVLYPMTRARRSVPKSMKQDQRIKYFSPNRRNGEIPAIASIDPVEDVFLVQYTGGTTGIPKGALLTHLNLVANAYQLKEWVPPEKLERGTYLAAIPFFHVYGMMTALLLPVLLGQSIIIVPDPRDLKTVVKALGKGNDISFPGIPTMYHAILESGLLKASSAGKISLMLSGAAPLPMELEKEFSAKTHATIVEGYGLTEASPVVSATPVEPSARRPGTVGFPIPNTVVRFVDMEDRQTVLPDGSPGELVVRGPPRL